MPWVAPPLPLDESQRLEALRRLNLLDTPAEERYDRITRLSRRVFDVPVAVVSLVDADREWFKSSQGLSLREIPRAVSFGGHAILRDQALIVPDTRADPRFAGNPLVTNEPNIRFYGGYPIRGPEGHRLGTLGLIDRRPRALDPADVGSFRDLAMLAENELKVARLSQSQLQLTVESALLRQQAVVDPLTQIWNRRGISDLLRRELAEAERQKTPLGILMADVDFLKGINETFGQVSGDEVLRELSQRFRTALRPYDTVGRYGGEEFLILLPRLDAAGAAGVAERIRTSLEANPIEVTLGKIPVTLSMGATAYPGTGKPDGSALIATAEAALVEAKKAGRNRVQIAPPGPPA